MRQIPPRLLEHYKSSTLSLARLWKITREDGQVFGFTDLDENIEFEGVLYKASTGFIPSAIETKSAFGVDNLDVQSIFDDESITEHDLKIGLWDGAEVLLLEVNYRDLSMGCNFLRKGYIGEVKNGRMNFQAELRGLSQRLQTMVGRIYNPACDADLGDNKCKVDLGPLRKTLVIMQVVSPTHFRVQPATIIDLNDTYFVNGLLQFETGDNAGFKSEIKGFEKSTGDFYLHVQPPYNVAVGDQFVGTPGCLKDTDACKRFSNLLNFRGFPDVPGADRLIAG